MNDWSDHQKDTLNDKIDDLLVNFLDMHYKFKTVIDLGCGAGNESVYLLKKGYNVTAIDRQLNKDFILNRLTEEEKKHVNFIESDFKDVVLPKTDCIIAMYSIPFCEEQYFDILWQNIYNSINDHGYFVGTLFHNKMAFGSNVKLFSKEEILNYLSRYEILLFEEVDYYRQTDDTTWHYFNVIARK